MKSRRFSRPALRRPREPVSWFRQRTSTALTSGTAAFVTLFDPATEIVSALDTRFTIMRVRLELTFNWIVSAAGNSITELDAGVFLKEGTNRNPNLGSATDQEADWLSLFSGYPPGAAISNLDVAALGVDWVITQDIKAKRKLDVEQALTLGFIAVFAGTSLTLNMRSSVLFQRTMRR